MLMDLATLMRTHSMKVDGVLHLGAHVGEEARSYYRCGVGPVWWVEADAEVMPDLYRNLARYHPEQVAVHACVSDHDDYWVTFHRANNHQSSSLLELGTHKDVAPDVHYTDAITVRTITVDTLTQQHGIRANMINSDLQGAELLALRGATDFLAGVDYIYTEVNWTPLYVGCVLLAELDEWLGDRGFTRYDTMMAGNSGWGDAFYARPEALGL